MIKKLINSLKLITIIGLAALSVTIFALNTNAEDKFIYVAPEAEIGGNGSFNSPLRNIQRAVNEAAEHDKIVYLKPGTYHENNIKVREDVTVDGMDRNLVTIDGGNPNETVFKMEDDTHLENVTVKNGKRGVLIYENADVLIWNCRIIDNEKDGIKIEKGDIDEDETANIQKTIIANNGWNGIYSQERYFYIGESYIYNNKWEGVEFPEGSEGTIKDTYLKDNDGHGVKVNIDDSKIYIKDCTLRDNDKSGMEVRSRGGEYGFIHLDRKTKFYKNDHNGITQLDDGHNHDEAYWNDRIIMEDGVKFWENEENDIATIVILYE